MKSPILLLSFLMVFIATSTQAQYVFTDVDVIAYINTSENILFEDNAPKALIDKRALAETSKNLMNISPCQVYSFANIEFTIPAKGMAKIVIYDGSNQEIKVIANQIFEKGEYTKTLKANDLVKGVYYVTIEMSDYKETKKLTVAK